MFIYSSGKMASSDIDLPSVIQFGYINYKVDESSKMQSANCKRCKAVIKEKVGCTSGFVRHLSVSAHEGLRNE